MNGKKHKMLQQSTKWMFIISMVYIVIICALIFSGFINNKEVAYIIIGFGTALVSWLVTHALTGWLDRDEKNRISENIGTILNSLQGRSLSMVRKNRKNLPNDYFLDIFKHPKLVKLSGISNAAFTYSILKNKAHPLVTALTDKKNEGLIVEVLLCHPESSYIRETRDEKEGIIKGRPCPCSKDIIESINNICELQKEHSKNKLSGSNRMVVRLSDHPINVSITYVKESDENSRQTFLVGFLMHHDLGSNLPIYDIQELTESLDIGEFREICLKNFDELFKDSKKNTIFVWDKEGCHFDKGGLPESSIDCEEEHNAVSDCMNDQEKSVTTPC
uniref:Uncharacterized protein n=1 Tax=Candidatus Kentrum sp. FM TaxID=2126340 RepID=A0A450S7R5_9GAMM|nr:MAG: hypothetical protein BECKFM1743A_GA0114220_100538 [Candidatus Kentron sp. FM]VFJ48028.1 MAG: hypothetical protein BECKFM1743C_GA0114222_100538 [Candidatus Kentron sp. FM]VFK07685.1 MAG: hypothetical protein BECKFM1743B_GA0114221_100488 [Candidatus Kentron sp. FM]